jgi:hypothetical protein
MALGAKMTPLVIRMTIVSDVTTWSITYNRHSDDHNCFTIQASEFKCIYIPYSQLMFQQNQLECF